MAAVQALATGAEAFPHIRIVMGMVVGLGVTRLLSGVARIIQHPSQYRLFPVHLAWTASVLLMLIHFWWWEFGLFGVGEWTFGVYLFIIGYAVLLFLLAALLFPDSMLDYSSYEDFFFSRRRWFFGAMAGTYLFDIVDTLIKGEQHFARFGNEYLVRTPIFVALCIAAAVTPNRTFHTVFVILTLVYQVSWILRLFNTIA
jgi:hypothetical protein